MTAPLSLSRRSALGVLAGSLVAGGARAQTAAGAGADLGGVTLRIAYYKGGWRPLLQAAGEDKTPYRIEWKELNNGVLHIEALNGDALDIGSGSEIPAMFAARQNAKVRFIAVTHEDLNIQVTVRRRMRRSVRSPISRESASAMCARRRRITFLPSNSRKQVLGLAISRPST
ncbi:hypothetical protein [Bradyrhizobium viridifuturi]|uniref:hypothetical protein n=1 Tax=Bradyrhizobium viridifuturi TaxID=1654716 RepID=UPI001FCDE218|nr:hypothetical protein [Bradyrhizobium viridifuturi]